MVFYVRINNIIRKFYAKNFRTNFKKDDISNRYYISISIILSLNDFYYLELTNAIPTRVKFHISNDTTSNIKFNFYIYNTIKKQFAKNNIYFILFN